MEVIRLYFYASNYVILMYISDNRALILIIIMSAKI